MTKRKTFTRALALVIVSSFIISLSPSVGANGNLIPQSQMTAISPWNSQAAPYLLDGNQSTYWQITENMSASMPYVSLDLGGSYVINAMRFLPRVSANGQSTVEAFTACALFISNDSTDGIDGTWYQVFWDRLSYQSTDTSERVIAFSPIRARFVRWRHYNGKGGRISISEFNVQKAPDGTAAVEPDPALFMDEEQYWLQFKPAPTPNEVPKEGMKAYISWDDNPPSKVIDGASVIDGDIRFGWTADDKKLHPYVVIDMGQMYTISSLRYQPWLDNTNQDIRKYSVHVCNDFSPETMEGSWVQVAFGTFTQPWQDRSERVAGFAPVEARYVMFKCEDGAEYNAIAELFIEKHVPDEEREFLFGELKSRLADAIVMYIDSTTSFVNTKYRQIEKGSFIVRPVVIEGTVFVPVKYVAVNLGAELDWNAQDQTITIDYSGKSITMKVGEGEAAVDGQEVGLGAPVCMFFDKVFMPLAGVSQVFDKKVFIDDRGIIVISDTDNIFDSVGDSELLDQLYHAKYKGVEEPLVSDVTKAPQPPNVNERKDKFIKRNMPENVDELGRKFFSMIKLDKPELAHVKAYVDNLQYSEALKAFRDYFMEKVPSFNWMWNVLQAFEYTNQKGDTVADELIYNITTPPSGGNYQKIELGEPGTVNWEFDLQLFTTNSQFPRSYMLHLDQFFPLIEAYIGTCNSAYLEKFFDFADDLLLNRDGLDTRYAINTGYNSDIQSVRGFPYFIRYLCWLVNVLPQKGKEIPETSLARILLHRIIDYLPVSMVYSRNNSQNWENDILQFFIASGILMDDFKLGDFYLNEGIRGLKAYGVQSVMPDGSEAQMFFEGYNTMYIHTGLLTSRLLLSQARPDLLTEELNQFIDNRLKAKLNYFGRYYIGYDGTDPTKLNNGLLLRVNPNIYDDPVLGPIYAMRSGLPETRVPPFTSDAFPYQGVYIFRTGWDLAQSQKGQLKATNGFGGQHGQKTTNELTISAYGQDLLKPPYLGPYSIDASPLLIDDSYDQGRNNPPNYTAMVELGHKKGESFYFDAGLKKENRWLSTERIDFAEGIYDQGFGSRGKPDITDVTHRRMVSLLKDYGIWIVGDKINATLTHKYAFRWLLPIKPTVSETVKAFDKENIIIDSAAKTVKTNQSDMVNLSMYQVSNTSISYSTRDSVVSDSQLGSYVSTKLREVSSIITGKGPQSLITVLYPRREVSDDLESVTAVSTGNYFVNAANISMRDGTQIWYAFSISGKQELSIGGIQAKAESLLVIQDNSGEKRGMALGCDSIKVDNVPQSQIRPGSFVFTVSDGSLTAQDYAYPPLDLVDIYPDANVFHDQVQITLVSKDEDVDIRYTINGGDPDLSSPLYTGPITLTESSVVKARAFRKGVTKMPGDNSCTQMSEVSVACFEKTPLMPALEPREVVNGMKYKYYEGYWKDLITFNDYNVPKKEGIVDDIIDITPRETDHYFAFEYEGYIDIPKDGVYTFYAQDEYVKLIEDAGYELQVFVDGVRWRPQALLHGFGTWSIPLAKGLHSFKVQYMDYRSNNAIVNTNANNYAPIVVKFDRTGTLGEEERKNQPGTKYRDFVWNGVAPKLRISGPDMEKQVLPASMLYREPDKLKVNDVKFYLQTQEGMVDITSSGLTEGSITAQISLTNNIQGEAADVVMLIALHSAEEDERILKGIWIGPKTSVESAKTEVLTQSFDIAGLSENDELTVYLWSGTDNIKPLHNPIVFSKQGISE